MNSMVSVAMKAGTRSVVTSKPLMSPMTDAGEEGGEEGDADAGVEEAWREGDREDGRHQPVGGADGEVEILVDDDECHADGHDAIAGGIAQDGGEGVGFTEEGRIDVVTDQIEQHHENEQPNLPPADQLKRMAAGWEVSGRCNGGHLGPPVSSSGEQGSTRRPRAAGVRALGQAQG
jgi:hypothetical protein